MTQDAPSPQEMDLSRLLNASDLPDSAALLKDLVTQLALMLRKETKRREEAEQALDVLIKQMRRIKSLPPCEGQRVLFDVNQIPDEPTAKAIADEADTIIAGLSDTPAADPPARKARPHGRRRLLENIEQVDIVHDIPAEIKQTIPADRLVPLPDVVTHQYDYQPGKFRRINHIQKKYLIRAIDPVASDVSPDAAVADTTETCASKVIAATSDVRVSDKSLDKAIADYVPSSSKTRESSGHRSNPILIAKKVMALPSCLAAPGLLAFVWLNKYGDHLPLYRQESITERLGIVLPRSTLCDWMMDLADVLEELYQRMVREVLRSRVIHTDDTTVQRQDPQTGKWSTARFWNYLGDADHRLTVLQYTLTHERTHPATFLRGYVGYLHADAYNGYDGIYLDSNGNITEVGCWQHARKRFKASVPSDIRATVAMAFIKSLYATESKLRARRRTEWSDLTIDEYAARVVEVRMEKTAPLLTEFGAWLRKTSRDVLPKSDLAGAIRYTLNQWEALNEFTKCGLLHADNNAAERAHRGIAIGRNNWRMVGSDRGGRAAAIHFSFIASCKQNGIDPFAYLVDVLTRLPTTSPEQLDELMPHRWRPAASQVPTVTS